MDRYWRELERERCEQGVPEGWKIISPLGAPPAETSQAGRLPRAWHKYIDYPLAARRAARRKGVRVVHVLDHSFAHLLAGIPSSGVFRVATVHDLAPLRDSTELTPGQRVRFRRTVENLRRADLVLADSRHSADEALDLLGLEPERIRVLPLGVHVERFMRPANERKPPPAWRKTWSSRKVILSVGVAAARKNLQVLPAILRDLKERAPDLNVGLLRVGPLLPAALREELQTVLGKAGLIELGFASEGDLVAAYQHSDALVFPSRIEGFGFPVLEAMAAGCPVVCTNVTSLPEVGGEAALYFAPDEPSTASTHLVRLFEDTALRDQTIALSKEQAAMFSWSEHYRQLLEIYQIS